jgi:hypothetical protein
VNPKSSGKKIPYLMLFLIRGIASDYQFLLRTEIPGLGGKFDDLIFKYSLVKHGEVAADRQTKRAISLPTG